MNDLSIFLIMTSNYIVRVLSEAPKGISNLGYIILGVIVSPVIILLTMSLLGKPRKMSITLIFLSFLVFMLTAFITITYALSFFTSFFF